ncbi:TPM domain-containing protein [Prosthecobacter sp.]|uniref:TPM domain-containing protein n=1 Tax=Prosthecobacter sp. TaxID=1965333 RepID=UPI0024887755|nr:TPM domain-containing protein [Prosthecobacter sp.]MDI1314246.1 TPM domain-containing protein [Prosthecobacter sp.]
MKCPRCQANVRSEQTTCSACGFSATLLHSYLGNQWVRLERITDAAHCLRLEDTRRLEIILDDFERSFPQAFFAIYLGALPNNLNVAELGFWLLNQGAFNTHSVNRRNDFGIVLVVDPSAQTAAITLGYAIEHCFTPKTITQMMQTIGSHLRKGAFGMAIGGSCIRASEVLRKHARYMPWQPEASVMAESSADIGLQPLRGWQRPATRPLAELPAPRI